MIPAILNEKYVIRFCVNAKNANDDQINYAWDIIRTEADYLIKNHTFSRESNSPEVPCDTNLKTRRMRFAVSRMVSDPKAHPSSNQSDRKKVAVLYRNNTIDCGSEL